MKGRTFQRFAGVVGFDQLNDEWIADVAEFGFLKAWDYFPVISKKKSPLYELLRERCSQSFLSLHYNNGGSGNLVEGQCTTAEIMISYSQVRP
jgi:hypothetical protein